LSHIFGPVRQSGFMVSSLDTALEYWTQTMGIGPFFRMDHLEMKSFTYRGSSSDVDVSIALGNSGDMQIELVQQHNDAPSPYLDFLKTHGPGLQHYSVWTETYDDDLRRLSKAGRNFMAEGLLGTGTRFGYFEGGADGQPVMEVSELTPATAELFALIRDAAKDWDGQDPVRELT